MTIAELIEKSHSNAIQKGFWDNPREFPTMVMLIVTELSEAVEADRHGNAQAVREEIADVFIRLGDLCGGVKELSDMSGAIAEKMEKNRKRPRLHGKEY